MIADREPPDGAIIAPDSPGQAASLAKAPSRFGGTWMRSEAGVVDEHRLKQPAAASGSTRRTHSSPDRTEDDTHYGYNANHASGMGVSATVGFPGLDRRRFWGRPTGTFA